MDIRQDEWASPYLGKLYQMFINQWGQVDAFTDQKDGLRLPRPIIALDDDKLVGGLSFTAYRHPGKNQMVLWINALYVETDFRGKKLASRLIALAEEVAKKLGYKQLFVHTDIPTLYIKSGYSKWSHRVYFKMLS